MGCGASKGKGGDNKISPEEEILQEDTDAQVAQGEAQMKEKQVVEAVLAPSPFFLAPEMVEDAFVRAPFLKGAFDNKGVKYPHCPDDVARTYLHYDKLVFSPSPMQTEEGNLNDIVYSFQRPSHWQVKVTTGAEMDKLITKLAETLPEVAKRLNGDSQIKKAEQVAAYKRVQMGDFSENKVHMLQMTTELINEKVSVNPFMQSTCSCTALFPRLLVHSLTTLPLSLSLSLPVCFLSPSFSVSLSFFLLNSRIWTTLPPLSWNS